MKRYANLLKIILPLSLLPASASAITITVSAPSSSSTTFTITGSGTAYNTATGQSLFQFAGLAAGSGNFTNADFLPPWFQATGTFAFDGVALTDVRIVDNDYIDQYDMLGLQFASGISAGTIAASGSSTVDFSGSGKTFGDLVIGTYDISEITYFNNAPTLIVQYSSVPDTGSTAALLGVGDVALAFAKRRLG